MSTLLKLRRLRPPDRSVAIPKLRQFKSRGVAVRGRRPTRPQRRGAIVALSAFLMVAMIAMVAFSVDVGALYVARTELQRSADSGALAAAAEMLDANLEGGDWVSEQDRRVRNTARDFVALNFVGRKSPTIDININQSADSDLLLGEVTDWEGTKRSFQSTGSGQYNAVQVRVSRSDRINGEVPLFFAKIFGMRTSEVEARATAAFVTRMRGFRSPGNGRENMPLLPIAISKETLEAMLRGDGPDAYSWDNDTQSVTSERDGRHEADLFPERSGAAGNWDWWTSGAARGHGRKTQSPP